MAVLESGKLIKLGQGIGMLLNVLISLMPNLMTGKPVNWKTNKNPSACKPRKVSLDKVIREYFVKISNKLHWEISFFHKEKKEKEEPHSFFL